MSDEETTLREPQGSKRRETRDEPSGSCEIE